MPKEWCGLAEAQGTPRDVMRGKGRKRGLSKVMESLCMDFIALSTREPWEVSEGEG